MTGATRVPAGRDHRVQGGDHRALDRDGLAYAEAMTMTEPTVTDEMVAALRAQLGDAALVDRTAVGSSA